MRYSPFGDCSMTKTLALLLISLAARAATIEPVTDGVKLVEPFAVGFDRGGAMYICEYKGEKVTRLDKSGAASLFAGTGTAAYSGDGGPAKQAALRDPHGLVIAGGNIMYIAD